MTGENNGFGNNRIRRYAVEILKLINAETQEIAEFGVLFGQGFFEIGRQNMVNPRPKGQRPPHEMLEQIAIGTAYMIALRVEQTVEIRAPFNATENIKRNMARRF